MRRLVPVAALLIVAACGNPVQEVTEPWCDLENGSAVLLMAQSAPAAQLVPCVADLAPGWSVRQIETGDSGASFTLHADDMGGDFLEVQLTSECPAAPEAELTVLPGGTAQLTQAVEESIPEPITAVVVGAEARHARAALSIAGDLRAAGVAVDVAPAGTPVNERLAEAWRQGHAVVVVGAEAGGVVAYFPPGLTTARAIDPGDVVDEIEKDEERRGIPRYTGNWQFAVAGGCVRYEFDAVGSGVIELQGDLTDALSFVSRTRLNRLTRLHVGIDLDP